MKKYAFMTLLIMFFSPIANAAHIYKEREYQKAFCESNGGVLEYQNKDNTRTDCLTKNYAIEFDFAPKWAELIGQSLYYSLLTGKKPGAVIILENPKNDLTHLKRAEILAKKYKVKLWVLDPKYLEY